MGQTMIFKCSFARPGGRGEVFLNYLDGSVAGLATFVAALRRTCPDTDYVLALRLVVRKSRGSSGFQALFRVTSSSSTVPCMDILRSSEHTVAFGS
ncbi:hypothetical protein MRX96_016054 [Rhipicephalus microplus]